MEKIKSFIQSEKGKDILTIVIVILTGLGCFELGRLSVENSPLDAKISPPDSSQTTIDTTNRPRMRYRRNRQLARSRQKFKIQILPACLRRQEKISSLPAGEKNITRLIVPPARI